MFEAAELGQKIKKSVFDEEEPRLHTALLQAQFSLREHQVPVIILVSGVEGAGKGEVVNRLHKWFDVRGLQTHAFWDETEEARVRPRYWRFWRALPPAGSIAIMFGSWYTQPIIDRAFEKVDEDAYDRELRRIEAFERLLADSGTLIIKFWFHLSKKEQKKRLQQDRDGNRIAPYLKKFSKKYDAFVTHSERALRMTDTGSAPWHVIEATDRRYRDLTVARTLLAVFDPILSKRRPGGSSSSPARPLLPDIDGPASILDGVDLSQSLDGDQYDRQLRKYQRQLSRLAWDMRRRGLNTVALFEGWDAGGKGGAIRRVTQAVDARLYRTISIAAPTDEERAHHYLWRFWRHIPPAGNMTIYDRSWYGRVLVERVEGFATFEEWNRAYHEINDFEEQLVEHGIVLLKFWLHISKDEQLRRFREREQLEWKKHKITDEDWRNREKWAAYNDAVNDMIGRTSTEYAPWTLVAANDKRFARVQILKTFCSRMESALA